MIALALALAIQKPALPPAKAGQCGWVHGRLAVYNGSSLRRIWVIGTTRIIAMRDEDTYLPPAIRHWRRRGIFENSGIDLFGDFLVCARERHIPGHMQHVAIKDARKLIVRPRVG